TERLLASRRRFRRHGRSGLWCSDAFPHLARHMDELCVLKGLYADTFAHGSAMIQMNSGRVTQGWPSLGSWLNYGLGSASEELPFRLQTTAPQVMDLSGEDRRTLEVYGLFEPRPKHRLACGPAHFGRQCLLARRLVERGVRFVQIYSGGGHQQENWDAHNGIEENLQIHAPEIDKPIHGLLTDLKQRGLLDETLIVWGGEFGRQPVSQGE